MPQPQWMQQYEALFTDWAGAEWRSTKTNGEIYVHFDALATVAKAKDVTPEGAKKYLIDNDLLGSLITAESGGNAKAIELKRMLESRGAPFEPVRWSAFVAELPIDQADKDGLTALGNVKKTGWAIAELARPHPIRLDKLRFWEAE